MEKFKGTPGPWRLTNGKRHTKKINGNNWYELASVVVAVRTEGGPAKISKAGLANAQLIASAPELLEALQILTELVSQKVEGINNDPKLYTLFVARQRALIVINKALNTNK